MKTRWWILLFSLLLLGCILAVFFLRGSGKTGCTAQILSGGVCVKTIDLTAVETPYTFTVEGAGGSNQIRVEPGRIRVSEADCPDKICVHTGYIHAPGIPIVCMPNKLVVRIVGDAPALDGMTK